MTFKKLKKTESRASYALKEIKRVIVEEEYEVRDQLPPEKSLARKLGISRGSVREALAAMRLSGELTSRAGKGTYIEEIPSDNDALSILKKEASPMEMLEAREVIEGGIAELAIDNLEDSDIEALQEILRDMNRAVEEVNHEEFLDVNRDFHLRIAVATGNSFIQNLMDSICAYMEEDLWLAERKQYYANNRSLLDKSLKLHKQIFKAIKQKDKGLVNQKLDHHFKKLRERF